MRRFGLASMGRGGVRANTYVAHGVNFDGVNDYATRGGDLTGNADGKQGTFSCWLDLTGNDNLFSYFLMNTGIFFYIGKLTNNRIRVDGLNTDPTPSRVLRLTSATTYTASTVGARRGWIHILMSWDLQAGVGHLFINDRDDQHTDTELINDNIDYTRADWGVFGRDSTGSDKTAGNLADLWFDTSYQDISDVTNRRKWIDEMKRPIDLGATGQLPTGASPLIYFSRAPTSSWLNNLGTGGGFTDQGAITDSTNGSPSA